ncbi:MAG: hypothetical protein K9H16_11640 [Bacteroidales bacterium]|nr:hypothetical protein [Bacteroidales bacterium]
MKHIDTSRLSPNECWGVQINGMKHCKNCKWTGISACEGQNIVKTGRNAKGYSIGDTGLVEDDWMNPDQVSI